MLQTVRENSEPEVMAMARFAADALRIELDKWRRPPSRNDQLKELREAGAKASKK